MLLSCRELDVFKSSFFSVAIHEEAGEGGHDVAEDGEGVDGKGEAKDAAFRGFRPVFGAHAGKDHVGPPKGAAEGGEACFWFRQYHNPVGIQTVARRGGDQN